MSNYKIKESYSLTATDFFILALEEHNLSKGTSGNTCRYLLELEGRLNKEEFKLTLSNHFETKTLSSFILSKNKITSLYSWKLNYNHFVEINSHESDELLPGVILNKNISSKSNVLFSFDLIYRSNGNTAVYFCWNHLLMDGYGAVQYLKILNGNSLKDLHLFSEIKFKNSLFSFKEALKAKFFLSESSKSPTTGISPKIKYSEVNQKIKVVKFTEQETKEIDNNSINLGAKFGNSPFFLACSARVVNGVLEKRKINVSNFWIPVPQNQRKKGATGPLIGNHLSFLFFRISGISLNSLENCVKSINDQMIMQVRNRIPKAYYDLMNYLKKTPTNLYYKLIKGPQGESLSSFLFTVAEEHPKELLNFQGLDVIDALSFPPNTYPPGLTFAFMRFKEKLQLMILTYDEVLSEKEFENLIIQIKFELINGKHYV